MLKSHDAGALRKEHVGSEVTLCGWVDTLRVQGKVGFLLLRDRAGIVQCFLNPLLVKQLSGLSNESVVLVKGKVNARPTNQVRKEMLTGDVEVETAQVEVLSAAETPLPIELQEETTTQLDKRLDYRFLDVRRQKIAAIFIIRSKIYELTVKFFSKEGFIAIQSPKLTASGVESGAEEFKIPYFGKVASLAQSPQVYKQMFVISGLEKVFEIGPIFRAEKSHTTRHLTEFIGIDFEMGFIKDENDVMDVIEKYLKFLTEGIAEECKEELEHLGVTINVPKTIPKMTLTEARKILKDHGKILPDNEDLDAEGERIIGEYVKKRHNCDFVFMLEYPWAKRPFYHMRPEDNKKITKSFDLLFNGVEIATGAQREHRLEILEAQAKEKDIDFSKMTFYR